MESGGNMGETVSMDYAVQRGEVSVYDAAQSHAELFHRTGKHCRFRKPVTDTADKLYTPALQPFLQPAGGALPFAPDVKFYAEKLCITPYYLSRITARTIGVTPKELIERQIILEMKRLLTTTDISVKELAVLFHFDTVSYMARFFRRHTGFTPNEYRKL